MTKPLEVRLLVPCAPESTWGRARQERPPLQPWGRQMRRSLDSLSKPHFFDAGSPGLMERRLVELALENHLLREKLRFALESSEVSSRRAAEAERAVYTLHRCRAEQKESADELCHSSGQLVRCLKRLTELEVHACQWLEAWESRERLAKDAECDRIQARGPPPYLSVASQLADVSWRMCIWLLLQVISAARRVKEQYDLNLAEQQMRLEAQIVLTRAHQPRAHANARARVHQCARTCAAAHFRCAHIRTCPSMCTRSASPRPLHFATLCRCRIERRWSRRPVW